MREPIVHALLSAARRLADDVLLIHGDAGAAGDYRAWGSSFFFDGRARSLEDLALQPILDPTELGSTTDGVLSLARSSYRSRFRTAFDAEPSLELVAKALASYMRTIVVGSSAFDRFAAGKESALTTSARRGLTLFFGKAGCGQCHAGPNLTDEEFHNTGVAWRTGVLTDQGRAGVTGAPVDRAAFKTPTLREISPRITPDPHDRERRPTP